MLVREKGISSWVFQGTRGGPMKYLFCRLVCQLVPFKYSVADIQQLLMHHGKE